MMRIVANHAVYLWTLAHTCVTSELSNTQSSLLRDGLRRLRAERALEAVKDKLVTQTNELETLRHDYGELHDEYERLQQRHAKLVADLDNRETHWQDK